VLNKDDLRGELALRRTLGGFPDRGVVRDHCNCASRQSKSLPWLIAPGDDGTIASHVKHMLVDAVVSRNGRGDLDG
jgi:hypothetical protein